MTDITVSALSGEFLNDAALMADGSPQMGDEALIDAYTAYQRNRAFSEHTIKRRVCSLNRFRRHMAPQPITRATAADVEEWIGVLIKPRTKHAYRGDLAAFFKWAHRRELVDRNVMLLVDPVRVPKGMAKPAPPETIAMAMTRSSGDTQVMILLGALAGLRRSEIAGLQRGDIYLDGEPPVIHVRHGKGDKDRVVPIHPTLLQNLRKGTCWLYRARGVKYNVDAVGRRLQHALTFDDENRITGHQLRHYFGTEAARWSGGNVVLVGQLMGHDSTDTTMNYIKWSPTEGADVVNKIITAGVDDEITQRRGLRSA